MRFPTVSRRLAIAALASGLVPHCLRAETGQRVIVVGAGLAGLSAARMLQDAGIETLVLEARDRIGGRIWTSRLWPDLPVDLGASWIHGVQGNPLTGLADAAAARRLSTSYDASLALDEMGREVDLTDSAEATDALIETARKGLEKDVSLKEAVAAHPGWTRADARARRLIRHQINGSVEAEYGGDWSEVSAWSFDDSEEFGGGDVLFPGGFDQITNHLARGLTIRLGQRATELAPLAQGVEVTLADGSVLTADHVVVTVPLGVLQAGQLAIAEPLAPSRQAAIDTMRMGLLNKCWLRFDRIAWPEDVDWIEWLGPEDGHFAQWVSLAHVAGLPVLMAFHAGQAAREREAQSDAALQEEAHGALKAMFGNAFPVPVASQTTRWAQDPLALGAYSFNAVGVSAKTRKALAGSDWEGRLVFAGEAASPRHFGTAHGAVLSGRAAAATVLG